jgi:hypothetical protein
MTPVRPCPVTHQAKTVTATGPERRQQTGKTAQNGANGLERRQQGRLRPRSDDAAGSAGRPCYSPIVRSRHPKACSTGSYGAAARRAWNTGCRSGAGHGPGG